MTQDENHIAQNKADHAKKDASLAFGKAEHAKQDAKIAIDKAETELELEHATGESSEMALKEAKEALVIGERARIEAEDARSIAEHARSEAETARKKAEKARTLAEETRSSAESNRSITETERIKALDAKKIAEEARDKAERALKDAELAKQKAQESEEYSILAQHRAELYAQELEQSNRDLEQFAAVVSHDLKSPLRKIKAFTQSLEKDEQAALKPESLDGLKRMQRSITNMEQLIDDLLAFSQVAQGEKMLNQTSVNLAEVLTKVLADLQEQISQKNAQIETELLCTIQGDADQLYQLFQNLLQNSLKYQSKNRSPHITIFSKTVEDGSCEIIVKDNGIGFEQKDANRIFEIFQRLHNKSNYSGTGIGLAICKRIVERHDGSIRAEGKPGEGSTFIVQLPTLSGA